mgnify:CR=1 FL=1
MPGYILACAKSCLAFTASHWRSLSGLALLLLTLLSLLPIPEQVPAGGNDKILHLTAWGLAIVPAALALGVRVLPVAVLFLAISSIIEFLQPLSGRTFEVADMLANGVGLALGALLGIVLRRWPGAAAPQES